MAQHYSLNGLIHIVWTLCYFDITVFMQNTNTSLVGGLMMRWSVNHFGHCVLRILYRSSSSSNIIIFIFTHAHIHLSYFYSTLAAHLFLTHCLRISLAKIQNLHRHSTSSKHRILLNLLIIHVTSMLGKNTHHFQASYPLWAATPCIATTFSIVCSLVGWMMATIYIRIVVGLCR